MKIFLYASSGLILFGCWFSWMRTGVHPDRPVDELLRVVMVLVAAILFCTGAVIGAIERASTRKESRDESKTSGAVK
jgi:apolipoprotein N-acyltransferase